MLDEAIEYLKSLQLQVQMMSMGCGMVPMMFPGVQQYMPTMGMGIGMGMGMDIGRPTMPFTNVLAGSPLPTPAAAAHLGPRFPMPPFHMPPPALAPAPDPSRIQPNNQSDTMLNRLGVQNPNQPCVPNFADPYQQYNIGLHPMQLSPPLNQAMAQPSSSKPSTSKGADNLENHPSGMDGNWERLYQAKCYCKTRGRGYKGLANQYAAVSIFRFADGSMISFPPPCNHNLDITISTSL
ncbi:hypothetical protein Gorai_021439 [Gossypium raimondii]|uniref:BHLH domain-containing protein n=1 Tax=Gossypium raimondii TaxID=29730 RepID=A0A7J8NQH9_GOSRA|nr:hypothetical protein [Gossypium raimondii]